uniref:Uncharacterized protein n=1 Tax=Acrobeloides nanus TaxID=290746 RepID=A0A914E1L3_9BILA
MKLLSFIVLFVVVAIALGKASAVSCANEDAEGPCIGGACSIGYTCDKTTAKCCPVSCANEDAEGPCIGGACSIGYTCDKTTAKCCPVF